MLTDVFSIYWGIYIKRNLNSMKELSIARLKMEIHHFWLPANIFQTMLLNVFSKEDVLIFMQ